MKPLNEIREIIESELTKRPEEVFPQMLEDYQEQSSASNEIADSIAKKILEAISNGFARI